MFYCFIIVILKLKMQLTEQKIMGVNPRNCDISTEDEL